MDGGGQDSGEQTSWGTERRQLSSAFAHRELSGWSLLDSKTHAAGEVSHPLQKGFSGTLDTQSTPGQLCARKFSSERR